MSTLTDACEQLKVYIIFVKAAVVFLCSYSGTSSTCNTRRGWRNQRNSRHPMGKSHVSPPGDTRVLRPDPTSASDSSTPHLWGRNTNLHLFVPPQLLTAHPASAWLGPEMQILRESPGPELSEILSCCSICLPCAELQTLSTAENK